MTTPREINPHSFLEFSYLTTTYGNFDKAQQLEGTIEEWIKQEVRSRNPALCFASFKMLRGIVTVNAEDIAVHSEPYDKTGFTFIDGIVCDPNQDAIMNAMAAISFEGQVDEQFVRYHLSSVRQSPQAVVARQGLAIYPFNPSVDTVIRNIGR